MSIFPLPLLLVFSSCLLCPVASIPGQGVLEVKSGHCTSAELIGTKADCQAAANMLGLAWKWARYTNSGIAPPGCVWANRGAATASGIVSSTSIHATLWFNTNKASTEPCYAGTSFNYMCLCVDACPIGNYQNEESSKTCKSCRPGTYNDETGQASCQNCTIGKYNDEIGESTCRNCPPGKNSARGASNCQPNCCHAKANYPTYEKDCNTITDAAACSDRLHHLVYTCDWNCDDKMVVDVHNVTQKYLRD